MKLTNSTTEKTMDLKAPAFQVVVGGTADVDVARQALTAIDPEIAAELKRAKEQARTSRRNTPVQGIITSSCVWAREALITGVCGLLPVSDPRWRHYTTVAKHNGVVGHINWKVPSTVRGEALPTEGETVQFFVRNSPRYPGGLDIVIS